LAQRFGREKGSAAAAGKAPAATGIVKHSLVIAGHRTSVSLEHAFWSRLKIIAATRRCSVAALVAEIDAGRAAANLSSAIRVFVLQAQHDVQNGERPSRHRRLGPKPKGAK
jgi:predicted DNA-binding ribbon-helix-helix protein